MGKIFETFLKEQVDPIAEAATAAHRCRTGRVDCQSNPRCDYLIDEIFEGLEELEIDPHYARLLVVDSPEILEEDIGDEIDPDVMRTGDQILVRIVRVVAFRLLAPERWRVLPYCPYCGTHTNTTSSTGHCGDAA
jgi:hypothetical protein